MNEPSGIMVLGANGFVGQHLIKRLVRDSYTLIYAIDHGFRGITDTSDISSVICHQSTIDNPELLHELLPKCGWLIHLAWGSIPSASTLGPVFEAKTNLLPTLGLLEILQQYSHINVLFLSTGGAIYGDTLADLFSETIPPAALSFYAAGKAAVEQFITAWVVQQQRRAIILRPANLYGPGQLAKPGFGIVPTWLQLLQAGAPLEIWGDGGIVRDYLYIDDFIELLAMVINKPNWGKNCNIYNVGSEIGVSLNELSTAMSQVTGFKLQRIYHPARAVDVRHVVLNCKSLKTAYPWVANVDLISGLQKTWRRLQAMVDDQKLT